LEISKKIGTFIGIFFLGTLIGSFFYKGPVKIKEISQKCACACHQKHEEEMKNELAKLDRKRKEELEWKAAQSERLMKEQEEYCSRPFKEFLEEMEKNSPQLFSS